MKHSILGLFSTLAVLILGSNAVHSQVPGVTANEILIGSCSALTGPASFLGTQMTTGAQAYFDEVNASGGVHGRQLRLLKKDDGYEPTRTIRCVNELIKQDKVFALGFFVGTPTGAKAAPMAQNKQVPLIGLFTGAELLRNPVKHWVVNIRASYYDETRAMIDNLVKLGQDRVAVFYQEDAFGKAVLSGVQIALARHGKKPIALGTYKRNTMDTMGGLEAIQDMNPDAIVMVGTYAPLAQFVRDSRARGLNPLFLNVSFVGTEAFAREVGPSGDGVVITQVVPPPNRKDLVAVAEYHDALAKSFPNEEPNFVSLEGYITARIMVEGLRRSGPNPTRALLISSLEGMNGVDVGVGSLTAYSKDFHQAFSEVFPTVLRNGEAVVFDDWSTVITGPASRR